MLQSQSSLFVKSITVFLGTTLLAGCQSAEQTRTKGISISIQKVLTEEIVEVIPGENVDIIALRDAFLANHPGSTKMGLMKRQKEGWFFNADGSTEFRHYGTRLLNVRSSVISNDGKTVCIEMQGSWSGACVTLRKLADDKMRFYYTFGNGVDRSFRVRNIVAE